MNMFQTAWYWKRFYWKILVTVIVTGGGYYGGISNIDWTKLTEFQKIGVIVAGVVVVGKALDALVDQTFQLLTNGQTNGNGHSNGNGNGSPVTVTKPTS